MKKQKKCSSKEHTKITAISYCSTCKIYMCNKCQKIHSELCSNHHPNNLQNDNDNFTGICEIDGHNNTLNYFCKTHNELCCVACLCKIKGEGNGQHKDCDVCFINEIKDEKKKILEENIQQLENLSELLENSINEIKSSQDKLGEHKENIKNNIQKIFNHVRNLLDEREKELIIEADKIFSDIYDNEDIIEQRQDLENIVNTFIEKGKTLEEEWDDDNLNLMINSCIYIENNMKEINEKSSNIKKYNLSKKFNIKFIPKEGDVNEFLDQVQNFGKIYFNDFKYQFKKCPDNVSDNRKYRISGEKENILVKTGTNYKWMGTICLKALDSSIEEHVWKIKILKSIGKHIMIGVAPSDFSVNISAYNNCGWYLHCADSTLYSGPPYNYNYQKTDLNKVKDEVIMIMNMKEKTLKYIINNEDKGESYTNIPLDKPIFPAVFLYNSNDLIEIDEC
jgi:hypothetical protein